MVRKKRYRGTAAGPILALLERLLLYWESAIMWKSLMLCVSILVVQLGVLHYIDHRIQPGNPASSMLTQQDDDTPPPVG